MKPSPEKFPRKVGIKERRKLRAKETRDRKIWFSLGMFGLVGWSVAVPTLLGIAAGVWVDNTWPSKYSWTLTGLVIGVALGCLNAWFWIQREGRNE